MKKIILILLVICSAYISEAQEKKYGIEKGMVVYEMELMGSKSTITMYFKDYGTIQSSVSEISMFGMSTKMRTIEKDGFVYNLNLNKKTGFKTSIDNDENDNGIDSEINYEELTDDELVEYNAKKVGYEVIAGKKGTVYTLNENGSENTFCIWKNIPLKWEAKDEGVTILTKAIEVSESPAFPEGVFEIPNDYNITEM